MSNQLRNNIRRNARWLLRLTALYLTALCLAACYPKTEEEQIAAANQVMGPEGHLTKTHLYIHWPAEYTQPKQYGRKKRPGGQEIVPAVTLKIPFEYLYESTIKIPSLDPFVSTEERDKALRRDYFNRVTEALLMAHHQILHVTVGLQHPGAKPYVPMPPYKSDPPDVAERKFANFIRFYAVHIKRNDHFVIPLSDRTANNSPYERPPRIDCVVGTCYAYFGVKGRQAIISGQGESLENYYKAKAARTAQKNAEPTPTTPTAKEPTSIPKWHEKLDPTQALLNSFILSEDAPEVRKLFYQEANK